MRARHTDYDSGETMTFTYKNQHNCLTDNKHHKGVRRDCFREIRTDQRNCQKLKHVDRGFQGKYKNFQISKPDLSL